MIFEWKANFAAGGMGEVDRAIDPVARFEREAETLASPNHQQITLIITEPHAASPVCC